MVSLQTLTHTQMFLFPACSVCEFVYSLPPGRLSLSNIHTVYPNSASSTRLSVVMTNSSSSVLRAYEMYTSYSLSSTHTQKQNLTMYSKVSILHVVFQQLRVTSVSLIRAEPGAIEKVHLEPEDTIQHKEQQCKNQSHTETAAELHRRNVH